MCCYNEPIFAKNLYRRIKNGKVIFYKVYEINPYVGKTLISPYIRSYIKSFGIIDSGIKNSNNQKKSYNRISFGIHVFVTEEGAEKYKIGNEIVIKVRVNAKDLLGAEKIIEYGDNAVFTKVEITEKEWNKVFKK